MARNKVLSGFILPLNGPYDRPLPPVTKDKLAGIVTRFFKSCAQTGEHLGAISLLTIVQNVSHCCPIFR